MKKYQIVELAQQFNHAGSKATADIAAVAERMGFEPIHVRMDTTADTGPGKVRRQIGYFRDWKAAEKRIEENSVLLLQHPFHYPQLTRERTLRRLRKRGVRIISLVHDVEELRAYRYNDYYRREFGLMLELADVMIVHNIAMKAWFEARGVAQDRLIELGIFDYLQNAPPGRGCAFERSVTIAGNLDAAKCGYIRELDRIGDITVHLYGPNCDEATKRLPNTVYHGSFPADELPEQLDRGFGLVWDGDSAEGCRGQSGQYLKYNNPHKLSLYLSSGLPVVIWKDAAEAGFVASHGAGVLAGSLTELPTVMHAMTAEDYAAMADNAARIGERLRSGYYAEAALRSALQQLCPGGEK